jgi:hypothetical protein
MPKIAIHTDFLSKQFNDMFLDFFSRLSPEFEIHLFLESTILLNFAQFLVDKEFALKIYPVFKERDYKENFEITDILQLLKNSTNCEIFSYPRFAVDLNKNTPEKAARDELIVTNSDTLILGETLISGRGMRLAEIAVAKNKRIFCFSPYYFSYGYEGCDILIKSGSAQILCPIYINEL